MKRSILGLIGALSLLVPACQARGGDPPDAGAAVPSMPAASGAAAPGIILARVNGREIPARELEQTVRIYIGNSGQDPKLVPPDKLKQLRKQLLESLVSSELLYQASQKAGIVVPDDAVTQQLRSLQGRFASGEEFNKFVQGQGITLADMKERMRRNLSTEQLVKKEVKPPPSPSDTEIADYYQKNKARMRREEAVKLSEIFVRADSRTSPDARTKARQKIESILKEVRGGKDFATLARQHSESPDATQGGEMGYVTRNGTLPALASAAFPLKTGETSDVVETPFGYHILKVTERKPAGDVTLKEAKPQISKIVSDQKERAAFNAYLATLKAGAKIEILTPEP